LLRIHAERSYICIRSSRSMSGSRRTITLSIYSVVIGETIQTRYTRAQLTIRVKTHTHTGLQLTLSVKGPCYIFHRLSDIVPMATTFRPIIWDLLI